MHQTGCSARLGLLGPVEPTAHNGGNTDYLSSNVETIWYHQFTARTSLGIRGQVQYIRPYGRTSTLPIFEKFFMVVGFPTVVDPDPRLESTALRKGWAMLRFDRRR